MLMAARNAQARARMGHALSVAATHSAISPAFPLRLRLAGRVRQLDGLRARSARVGAAVGNDVFELDAIVLLPHLA
jgi:hypothetical protein